MLNKLTKDDYARVADYIKGFSPEVPPFDFAQYDARTYDFDDKPVFPKQRPRQGKGNRFFTPPETRAFEATVKEWGYDCGMRPVAYPIAVRLVIRDYTPDAQLRIASLAGITYSDHGDLDNLTKGVMDALNGVLFKDDRQIVSLDVSRRWSFRTGFSLKINRAGLSKSEYENLRKFLT